MKVLSIIIPIYNGEKYLERLLKSIEWGGWTEELEVILVNDGSSDKTDEICQYWKSKFPDSILYISKENEGVCSARNKGLDCAQGRYVGFADQDDFFEAGAIGQLVKKSRIMDADMLIFEPNAVYSKHTKRLSLPVESGIWKRDDMFKKIIMPMAFGLKDSCGRGFNYGLWNCLFKREMYYKLKLDPYLRMGEDMTFIVQAIAMANSIETLAEPLYNWVANDASVSHTYIKSSELSITKTKYIYKKREEAMSAFPKEMWEKYIHANYASIIASFARNWTHRKSGENLFSTRKRILKIYQDCEIAEHVNRLDYKVAQGKQRIELVLIKHRMVSLLIIYFYLLHLYVGIRNRNMDSI